MHDVRVAGASWSHGSAGVGRFIRPIRLARSNIPPKIPRIKLLTPLLAAGRIKFVRTPGTSLLVEQLRAFPLHNHDDGPDALEMGIRLCEELLQGDGDPVEEEVLYA